MWTISGMVQPLYIQDKKILNFQNKYNVPSQQQNNYLTKDKSLVFN